MIRRAGVAMVLWALASVAWGAESTPVPRLPQLNWEPRSDWISVKRHGAVGDGVADDTAALQAAFKLIQRGVTLYFPPGTYRVTQTLVIDSPDQKSALYGVLIVGHGRDSRLVWDGPEGGTLIRAEGMGYSRWVGLDLDGAGKAALGQHHFSNYTFETVHRKQHLAFRNFTRAGVYADPQDKFAMAETSFENCLFENCGTGVSFTQFNDYDETFDGCEFRNCGTGIDCRHGNFYARNCHFEGSRVVDMISEPEHGCTIRRCTSLGSKQFLRHVNGVAVMTVEGCTVAGWQDPEGALLFSSAPALVFDCTFASPPAGAKCAINLQSHWQRFLTSQNTTPEGCPLVAPEVRQRAGVKIHEIPPGARPPIRLPATQQFLTDRVPVPGQVFDAKRDFGAQGDNRTDDAAALQAAIDAARAAGHGALAYVPAGRYVVKQTLRLTGGDYYFGGAGMLSTMLTWQGDPQGVTLSVQDPAGLTLEHLDLQKSSGVDVLQVGSDRPSSVTYDGLFVSRPNNAPWPGGIWCRGLNEQATVRVPCVAGLLRFTDCGRATVLVPLSYYGGLIVEGPERVRGGLLGVLSRFSGGPFNVWVRDSQSLVLSDFYSESSGNIFLLEGGPDDPPGRLTIQGAKLHLNEKIATGTLEARGYRGQIVLGPDQFNASQSGGVKLDGEALEAVIMGCCFYHAPLRAALSGGARLYQLGNLPVALTELPAEEVTALFADSLPAEKLGLLSAALDDLRRLGEADLRLNHPGVLPRP